MLANLKCSSCLCWKLWKLKSASWFHIIPGDDSLEYLLSAEGYEIILYTGRIANYLIRMSTTLANRPVLCDLLRVFGFDYFTCSQCLFTFTSISDVVPCFRGRLRIGFGARYFCRVFFFWFCFVFCLVHKVRMFLKTCFVYCLQSESMQKNPKNKPQLKSSFLLREKVALQKCLKINQDDCLVTSEFIQHF